METSELINRFSEHKSKNQFKEESIVMLHEQFYVFARQIDALIADGREKSLAMTKLEEAMFWVKQSLDITTP